MAMARSRIKFEYSALGPHRDSQVNLTPLLEKAAGPLFQYIAPISARHPSTAHLPGVLEPERGERREEGLIVPSSDYPQMGLRHTGCCLFTLESPRRLLCSRGVQNTLGDKGRSECQWRQQQGKQKEIVVR